MEKIIYICDCKKPCARFSSCQVDCFHTASEFHAKHGIMRDIAELQTDRFKKALVNDEMTVYIENEEWWNRNDEN